LLAALRDGHDDAARRKSLDFRVAKSGAVVISDPALLASVLRNLVDNAIKYTARGGVLVGCRRRREKLLIQVWDTGIGIAPEMLEAIFDDYRRLAPANGTGAGLGLAIVRHTANLLGHRVAVCSVVGKGSCFSVEMRLAEPSSTKVSDMPSRA
jgi:two-component system CheB/CheR fusion protein